MNAIEFFYELNTNNFHTEKFESKTFIIKKKRSFAKQ